MIEAIEPEEGDNNGNIYNDPDDNEITGVQYFEITGVKYNKKPHRSDIKG